jgi:hypothetical protein
MAHPIYQLIILLDYNEEIVVQEVMKRVRCDRFNPEGICQTFKSPCTWGESSTMAQNKH